MTPKWKSVANVSFHCERAFRRLRSALPLHPLDTLANKLSRLDVLRRSIKFIEAMSVALEYSEE